MATIDQRLGDGGTGRGVTRESGVDDVVALLNAAVDDLTELRTQFVALLTKLDVDVSLEEALQLVNDLKTRYEAHRVLTTGSVHANADSTNAVTAPPAVDLTTAYALANDLKTQYNAHAGALSKVEEAVAIANDLKTQYEAHRILTAGGVHGAADSTDVITAADATNLATAITLANDIKAQYEAHRVLIAGSVHGAADSTNVVSAADATDLASLETLLNELKTDYEAHRILTAGSVHGAADSTNVVTADAVGTAAIHDADDATNTISSANATTQATLLTLANELRTDYEAHRAATTVHEAADATNVVAEPASAVDYASTLTPAALTLVKGS